MTDQETQTKLLADYQVPDHLRYRILFEDPALNFLYGSEAEDGFIPTSINMITGVPGTGKTTTMLKVCQSFGARGFGVLYDSCEEHVGMLKLHAERMGLRGDFVAQEIHELDDLETLVRRSEPQILVIDSLQTIRGERNPKNIILRLRTLADETGTTVFLLGQVTKSGQMAGPRTVQHLVDTHLHITIDQESGRREACMEKNRFGRTWAPLGATMGNQGLVFDATQVIQSETLFDDIVERLMSGHVLPVVDPNLGQTWSKLVEEACDLLTQQDFTVQVTQVADRTFVGLKISGV